MAVEIIVPIAVVVVLPVLVVWLISRTIINRDNKNAEILIKALENNSNIDVDKLMSAWSKKEKTPAQILNLRLLRGCIFTFIGIAAAVAAIVATYNQPNDHLYEMLSVAGLPLAIGIAYLLVYFVTRKSVNADTNGND